MTDGKIMICDADVVIGTEDGKYTFYAVTYSGCEALTAIVGDVSDLGFGVRGISVGIKPSGDDFISELRAFSPLDEILESDMPHALIIRHVRQAKASDEKRSADSDLDIYYRHLFNEAFHNMDKRALRDLLNQLPAGASAAVDAERRMLEVFPSFSETKVPAIVWLNM